MQPIYILKGHFIGYHILFTKHKKVFLLWRNWPFSKTLIFADFYWRQQKLEGLWQQTAYQKTPFDRFYQLTKFHDQSFSQTGSIGQFLDAVGPHIQVKRHVTYIYILKEHFIGYHILFTKHKKMFLFWRNRPFSNTLIFANVIKN